MAVIINNTITPQEKTNIQNDIKISNDSYYYQKEFEDDFNQIMVYSMDIYLEKYFSEVLNFPLDRIIYASNEYCFRERGRKNGGELNIPFMNYYRTNYSETDRPWFKNQSNLRHILGSEEVVKELGRNFRCTPIKCDYEGTIFFSQNKDVEYACNQLLFEKSNETIIPYSIIINNKVQLNNTAIFSVDIDFNQNYNENDFLEQNKIFTLGLDFSLQTFASKGCSENAKCYIAKDVLWDFIVAKNGADLKNLNENDIISQIHLYFEGGEND